MTMDEVESIIAKVLGREETKLDFPSDKDWNEISHKFNCKFSNEFKFFINLISKYSFPGESYNVSTGKTNGNDSIIFVYDYEMKAGRWNSNMIPFYGVGNGDYFCLNKKECPNSKVYYYFHEDLKFEINYDSFEDWIKNLPTLLG